MPAPLVLRPKPWKWLALFGVFACCFGGYLVLALLPATDAEWPVWVGVLLFGLVSVECIMHLLPGASWLSLDDDGFTIHRLHKEERLRWQQVEEFFVLPSRTIFVLSAPRRFVAFDLEPGEQRQGRIRRKTLSLMGFENALPSTYGMRAEDLASLMEDWRRSCRDDRPSPY